MAILVACICIINIILWVIFLVKFKKLFSTDKIIDTTTDKMNRLVREIDNATDRDLSLTRESEKRIRELLSEAEKNMELFREAGQRLREMIAEAERITRHAETKSPIYNPNIEVIKAKPTPAQPVRKNIEAYIQNSANYKSKSKIDSESTYRVTDSEQQDLFSQDKLIMTDTVTNVTEDGAAYKEVPLIITKVYEEKPVENDNKNKKKNITKAVQELYNNGLTVEQIANELSCSITEVQLIIDINS